MAARDLRVVHEWLSFDRPRGRSPSGLSKLKPRVCNPVDHKQRHRIKYLYDDFRHKALTNENAPVDASI